MSTTNEAANRLTDTKAKAGRPKVEPNRSQAVKALQMHHNGETNEAIYKEWAKSGYKASKGTRSKYLKLLTGTNSQVPTPFQETEAPEERTNPSNHTVSSNRSVPIPFARSTQAFVQVDYNATFPTSDEIMQHETRCPIWTSPYTACATNTEGFAAGFPASYPSYQPVIGSREQPPAALPFTMDSSRFHQLRTAFVGKQVENQDVTSMAATVQQGAGRSVGLTSSSLLASPSPWLPCDALAHPHDHQSDLGPDLPTITMMGDGAEQNFEDSTAWLVDYPEENAPQPDFEESAQLDSSSQPIVYVEDLFETQRYVSQSKAQMSEVQASSSAHGEAWQQISQASTTDLLANACESSNSSTQHLPPTLSVTRQARGSVPMFRNPSDTRRTSSRGRTSQASTSDHVHKSVRPFTHQRIRSTSVARNISSASGVDSGYVSQQNPSFTQPHDVPSEDTLTQYPQTDVVMRETVTQNYHAAAQTSFSQGQMHGNMNQLPAVQFPLGDFNPQHLQAHLLGSGNSDISARQTTGHTLEWEEFFSLHEYLEIKGLVSTAAALRSEFGVV